MDSFIAMIKYACFYIYIYASLEIPSIKNLGADGASEFSSQFFFSSCWTRELETEFLGRSLT